MRLLLRRIMSCFSSKKQCPDYENPGSIDDDSKMCVSLRLMFIFNVLAGHWFAVSFLKIRTWSISYILSYLIFIFSHTAMLVYTYFVVFYTYKVCMHDEFRISFFLINMTGLVGVSLAFWRTCCVIMNQNKATRLLKVVMASDYIDQSVISKASRRSLVFMAFFIAIYCSFVISAFNGALQMRDILYNPR
jgi:hypothetical protein